MRKGGESAHTRCRCHLMMGMKSFDMDKSTAYTLGFIDAIGESGGCFFPLNHIF